VKHVLDTRALIVECLRVVELCPPLPLTLVDIPWNDLAQSRLAEVHEEMGRYDEALAYFDREYDRIGELRYFALIARLQARMGKREQARRTLEAAQDADAPLWLAAAHTALGDYDEAFRLLPEAFNGHERARLLFIKVDPWFASLRSDPRWPDLLQRFNLR
jgi:tetratricopeptide (TPR) repeat protein